jgi:hypothetical protein
LHPALVAGPLITHLCHEIGLRVQAVANHLQLGQLMHEGLLGVNVFVVLQRGEDHWRVVEVRHIDDDGIEIASFVSEGFAVILHGPGVGLLLLNVVQLALVHVAEAGPLDLRMALQPAPLHPADAADADLKDAQLAVLVDLRARWPAERGDARGDDGAGFEETPPGNRGDGGRIRLRVHDDGDARSIMHGRGAASSKTTVPARRKSERCKDSAVALSRLANPGGTDT